MADVEAKPQADKITARLQKTTEANPAMDFFLILTEICRKIDF